MTGPANPVGLGSLLDLSTLQSGCAGITPVWGASLAEAASVALVAQGHRSPHLLEVSGTFAHLHTLYWLSVTAQMQRCWNDLDEAAEHGAYGIAALLVAEHTTYEVVERSYKGTGFDYWLGPKDAAPVLFQHTARLEVSGIGRGDDSAVKARVRKKLKQTAPTDPTGLPAIVVVVEYGRPQARVADK